MSRTAHVPAHLLTAQDQRRLATARRGRTTQKCTVEEHTRSMPSPLSAKHRQLARWETSWHLMLRIASNGDTSLTTASDRAYARRLKNLIEDTFNV